MFKHFITPLILLLMIFGYGCLIKEEDEIEQNNLLIIQTEKGVEIKANKDLQGVSLVLEKNILENKVEIVGADLKIIKGDTIALAGGIISGETLLFIDDIQIKDINLDKIEVIENIPVLKVKKTEMLPSLLGDFNEDGEVGIADYVMFVENYFTDSSMGEAFNSKYDIGPARSQDWGLWEGIYAFPYPDGQISLLDFVIFAGNYFKQVPVTTGEGIINATINLTSFETGIARVFIVKNNWEEIRMLDITANTQNLEIMDLPTNETLAVEIDIPGYYKKKYYDIFIESDNINFDIGIVDLLAEGPGILRGNLADDVDNGWVNVYRKTNNNWEYLKDVPINTQDDAFEVQGLLVGENLIVEINVEGYHRWRTEDIFIDESGIFMFPEDIVLQAFGNKKIEVTIDNPGIVDGGLRVTVSKIISETEKIYIMDKSWYILGMNMFEVEGLETGEYLLDIEGEGFDKTSIIVGIGESQDLVQSNVNLIPGIEITAPIKNILEQSELPHFQWKSGNMDVNTYVVAIVSGNSNFEDIGPEDFNVALMAFDANEIEITDEDPSDNIKTFSWDYIVKEKTSTEQIYDFAIPLEERTAYMYMIVGFQESLSELQEKIENNPDNLEPISFGFDDKDNFFIIRGETISETSILVKNPNDIIIPEGSSLTYYLFKVPTDLTVDFDISSLIAVDQMIEIDQSLYPSEGDNSQIINNVRLMETLIKETVIDQYALVVEIDTPSGGNQDNIRGASFLDISLLDGSLTEPIEVYLGVIPDVLIDFLD